MLYHADIFVLNFLRRPDRKTLERELPVFLNLLKVTTDAGMDLPQSIKVLNRSSDTSCRHLVEIFANELKVAYATNTTLSERLKTSSQDNQIDLIAGLMKLLAVPAPDSKGQIAHAIDIESKVVNTMLSKKRLRLQKNYLRRWLPHILFFVLCALPLLLCPILGPAFQASQMAIGPNDYGIIPR